MKTNQLFHAECKTRYLALLVVLILTCGNVWGAETTYTSASEAATVAKNGISLSVTGGSLTSGDYYRIDKGKTLTISSSSGNITSIIFTCTTTAYAKLASHSPDGTYSESGTTVTWTGSAASVTFTAKTGSSNKNFRFTKVVITAGGGSDCDECTYYVYDGTKWVSIGTTGFDDVVLAPPTLPDNNHGAGNGCWTTDKDVFTSCTYYASGDKFRFVPNPGGAAPTSVNKPGSGTCELYAVYAQTNGCLSTTVTAVQCARIWEEPEPSTPSVSGSNVTLSWSSVTGASGYHLYVTDGDSYEFDDDVNSTSKTLTDLAAGTYSWSVAANSPTNDACDSNSSDGEDFTIVGCTDISSSTVTGVSVTPSKVGGTATWTAVANATSYEVKVYAGTATSGTSVFTAEPTTNSCTITGLSASTQYTVVVKAKNSCSTSNQGTATWTTSALTLYTVTFYNAAGSAPGAVTQTAEGGTVSIPSASACEGWTFVGWKVGGSQSSTTTDPTSSGTWITSASWPKNYAPEGNIDVYAVFSKTEGGGAAVTDELTLTTTGVSGTSYTAWSGKTATSSAVYAGNSAGGNSSIQLRSSNSNSGVVMTTSGGNVTKVTVVWNSNTASGRTLNVYGKNSAYSAATDLYNNSNQGTLIGTIVCGTSTELDIDDDYAFIGFRSASGAMYLDEVDITIGGGGTTTWRSDPPCSTAKLDHITITTPPTTTNYLVGQVFSSAGAVVTAYYDDESHHEVTASWTPTTPLTAGTGKTVTASYTEGGVTKTATTTINVYAVTLQKKDNTGATISGALNETPAVSVSVAALSAAASGNQYVFKEWQISGGTLGSSAETASNTIATVTGPVTVTAVYWKPITVKWYVNGSQYGATGTYSYGWNVQYPASPAPESVGCTGKVFIGWSRTSMYRNDTKPTDLVESGESLTSDENFYAIFADKISDGTPPTWTKTALGSVSAGTYLICMSDGKVFNGNISSGHGQVTSSVFATSLTSNTTINEDAPAGACEVTFTAVTNGFTMNVPGKGYLYAKGTTTGKLDYHETESEYWFSANSFWRYHGQNTSGTYVALYDYAHTQFKNSVTTSGTDVHEIILLKKTNAGVPATYSDYTTSCTCSEYQFHYQHNSSWNTENICFSPVAGATNNYLTEEMALPYAEWYKVTWQGNDQSYTAVKGFAGTTDNIPMPFYHNRGKSFGVAPQNGNIGGGKGRFHVYHDSGSTNKYVSFVPTGYTLNFGTGDTWTNDLTLNFTGKTSNWDETEWYTDIVTLTNAQIGKKIFVGLQTETGYVWCDPYSQKDNLSGLRTKSGSGESWVSGGMSTSYPNKTGKFRIYANSGDKNWYVTFVPYYHLVYDANGGSGAPAASEYVSCEETAANRTIAISATEPTRANYRFMGWTTSTERAAAGTVDYKYGTANNSIVLTGEQTLYAVWKQVYTVTYNYAGGTGTCSNGEYIEGEAVTVCASTPTKAGSDFNGWSYTPSVTVSAGAFTMPASNVVITATWTDHSYVLNHSGSNYTNTENQTTIKSGDTPLTLHYTCAGTYGFPNSISISGGGKSWTVGTDYTWTVAADKKSATLVIKATTITADVTITITMSTLYTVIWDEHGVTTTEYYSSDDNNVTLKTGIADCGEKKFYGWTEDAEFVSNPTTPPTMASSGAISGNKHYYAIYADATVPANPGYVKVTSISAGTYLIATTSQAYTGKVDGQTYGGHVAVTVSDGVINSKPNDAVEVTVTLGTGVNADKFDIYDGTYHLSSKDKGITFAAVASFEWQLTGEGYIKNTNGTHYLQYNSASPRFASYSSSQVKAYLYKKQTTTYENFAKTCAVYDITITTPSGGIVTTTPAAGTGVAGEGQTVTVNVTPNSCKYLSALKYNDGSDHAISIASTPYTFTMPASDVTVTATFADKSVSSIAANTATHRTLMQGTAFEGEQIRVTYNNGETEDLAWNASGLTFSGYNMSTLGNQTVSVAYSGSCGSANTSYDIEITDGIPVTFSDCGITTVNKYDPGATVPVKSTLGEYGCSGWVFDGWSETPIVHGSTAGYTIVENFSASVPKTLYAVYVKKENTYTSIDDASELLSGFQYAIMRQYSYNNHMILKAEAGTGANAGYLVAVNEYNNALSYSSPDYTLTSTEEKYAWQLQGSAGNWVLYNKSTNKYLDLSTAGNAEIESVIADRFTITQDAYDDHLFTIRSNTNTTYYLTYNSSYYKSYTSAQKCDILRRSMQFSSTPPCAPQAAIFHGNGGTVIADGGSPTGGDLTIREATRDAGITTPTAEYEDCDGKSWTFIGWADHEVDVTRVPVLTTDLLNDGGGNKAHAITTDGEEFWAVYTNQGEPMTQYGTISFSMSDIRLDYHTDETEVTKTVPAMGDYTFGYKRVGHQSNQGIQLEAGTGEFYNKTSLGKINSISFNTFKAGGINNLKVYVGDASKATTYELTAAELQVVGSTYTYYPSHNCEYIYIKNYNSYVCVEGISIEFGKGTKVWATTPDCKRVTLSGDIYATSTNGRGIMAVTPLRVNAYQLDPSAGIVISSNSSDVYFSTDRNANFAKAAANQPKTSVTVNAGLDGNLSTDVYVHYKPSSIGDGIPADVMVSANLAIPDPGVTASHSIHVRNLPEKFVIAAKVGATWYALPADMNAETNPSGVVIEVDETNMTATAPNTCSYTIWPVKTTNGEYDRYAINTAHYDGNAFGERVRFSAINNGNKGLWANNATSGNGIRNYAAITSTSDGGTTENTNPSYEWKITTTIVDGKWQYTLQTDQTQNDRYLRYWFAATGGPKWGTYTSGEQNLYFLPVTEVEPFEMQVVEWYPTKVLVQTEAALASPSVKVNGEAVASPVLTNKGGKLWEISGLPLESNPTKSMTVVFTADEKNYACTKTVPIIISRGTKTQADEPFATLGAAIYTKSDVVVRDGAVLTVNGSNAANTFNDVTIYPTSKISVPSDKKLTVHALTFFGGIDEIYDGSAYTINKYGVPELSLKGTLHKSIAQIDYVMRVDLAQMYQTGVPYDVNLNAITYWDGTAMTPGSNLYVSAYDGQARANKESKTWIWEEDFASKLGAATLKAGIGYTISAELQSGVGDTYSIIRMPMATNIANDDTEAEKTVNVTAYANTKGETISDNHKGWNYLSNPYMVSISGGEADSKLVVGYLQETGTGPWEWKDDTYRYVTIPVDNGTDYYQMKFSEATLKPFKSFFLQIGTSGVLTFALASRQNAPARYLETSAREVEFEILLSNASRTDNTGILIADSYSPSYEINADLEKMIGSMSVYTIYGGYNLAYNALSPTDAEQLIPVGYVAPSAGEYTFGLDEQGDYEQIEHIYLTDYEQGLTTDLLNESYTFMTATGKNESRFAINVILKEENSELPTGVDILQGDKDRPLKFIMEDKMYILRNGDLYDATGKKVK